MHVLFGLLVSHTARHDKVRDVLIQMFKEVQLPVEKEMAGLYANSEMRPADFLLPPLSSHLDRAIDVTFADPRDKVNVERGSFRQPLLAADQAEVDKVRAHEKAVDEHGFGVLHFDKVPAAFEVTGAFGKEVLKLWKEAKSLHKGLFGGQNYIKLQMPRTWTAFTFSQMYPQLLSFTINLWTARQKIRGHRRAVLAGYSSFHA